MTLPAAIREAIMAHADAEAPNECCGLLAGRDSVVGRHFPLVNAHKSPVAYFAEVKGLFAALKAIRAENLDVLATYHSHPTSAAVPSRRDVEQWTYGDAAMVIVSLMNHEVNIWRIVDGNPTQV